MNGLILSDKADIITEGPIRQGIVDDQKEEIEQEGPPARAKTSIEVLRSEYISTTGRGSRSAGSLLPHLSVSKSVPVRVVIEDFNDKGVNSSAMRENQNSRKTPKKHKTKQGRHYPPQLPCNLQGVCGGGCRITKNNRSSILKLIIIQVEVGLCQNSQKSSILGIILLRPGQGVISSMLSKKEKE